MKNTIKLLNDLRDQQTASKNFEVSYEIGTIIRTLLNEQFEINQKNYNESLKMLNRLTKNI